MSVIQHPFDTLKQHPCHAGHWFCPHCKHWYNQKRASYYSNHFAGRCQGAIGIVEQGTTVEAPVSGDIQHASDLDAPDGSESSGIDAVDSAGSSGDEAIEAFEDSSDSDDTPLAQGLSGQAQRAAEQLRNADADAHQLLDRLQEGIDAAALGKLQRRVYQ